MFGSVLEWSHYYNKYLYVAVWICNGLLQSTGWPAVVAVMGNWFGRSRSVFVMVTLLEILKYVLLLLSFVLTLLHSERPKLYTILAFLSAKGLTFQ